MNTEIWKDISDFEGHYQVSNFGRVKSLERRIMSGNPKRGGVVMKEKVLRYRYNRKGYASCQLCLNGICKSFAVARLVLTIFIGENKDKPFVNHINCIRDDNRLENLEWVTAKENTQYAYSLGRMKRDEATPKISSSLKEFYSKNDSHHNIMVVNIEYGAIYKSIKEAATSVGVDPSYFGKQLRKGKYINYAIVP